jgi:hypothetical protein
MASARRAAVAALAVAAAHAHSAPGGGCGAPISPDSYTRCAANPLARAGYVHADTGLVEVSIGDPDVSFDAAAATWRAFWSTGLAPSYLAPNTLVLKAAASADGFAWDVAVEPVLRSGEAAARWDFSAVETPSVVRMPAGAPPERAFLLLYSGGNHAVPHAGGFSFTWYQLGAAFSPDPALHGGRFNFTRAPSPYAPGAAGFADTAGLVLLGRDAFPGLAGVADGIAADPDVIVAPDGTLHVFFSSMAVDAAGAVLAYGLGHATSRDGVAWTVARGNPFLSGGAGPSIVTGARGAGYSLFFYEDSAADRAAMPSVFSPERGAFELRAAALDGPWAAAPGNATGGRAVAWDGSVPTEALGWVATGDVAAGAPRGERRWYYPAFSVVDVPSGFVAPTHNGTAPAVFALSVMVRAGPAQ